MDKEIREAIAKVRKKRILVEGKKLAGILFLSVLSGVVIVVSAGIPSKICSLLVTCL